MKDRCPADQPEVYAPHYLQGEEHAELFEKIKLLHDEAQEKGLVCFLVMQSPNQECKAPILLFHLNNTPNKTICENAEDFGRVVGCHQWLCNVFAGFNRWLTASWPKSTNPHDEGEEWKKE